MTPHVTVHVTLSVLDGKRFPHVTPRVMLSDRHVTLGRAHVTLFRPNVTLFARRETLCVTLRVDTCCIDHAEVVS